MADRKEPKRFALLVGINAYLSGQRTDEKDKPMSLNNLGGCINDVNSMNEFLHENFQSLEVRTLTSTPSPDSDQPIEPEDQWPTFENIKKEFDYVYKNATAGDLFLFHFSGHGSQLKSIPELTPQRTIDPSLLPLDYCRGGPPLRGWQLNLWLKEFHEKGIAVLVILDSCHSGGAWRNKNGNEQNEEEQEERVTRSPGDWSRVPNLPTDENAAQLLLSGTLAAGTDRNADLGKTWSINPHHFTVLVACHANELARETMYKGKMHGVFTSALLSHFEIRWRSLELSRYRDIRHQVAESIKKQQTPQVYGRDHLSFYKTAEPLAVAPLIVKTKPLPRNRKEVIIPVGKVHGVGKNTEFEPYSSTFSQVLRVSTVNLLDCRAIVSNEEAERLEKEAHASVIPLRWSLGSDEIEILVSSDTGAVFQETLKSSLQDRFVNKIQITPFDTLKPPSSDKLVLSKLGHYGIDIFGPEDLVGYPGPVRALDIENGDTQRLATHSAVSLSHIIRFRQVLNLGKGASKNPEPFEISLKPANLQESVEGRGPFREGQKFELAFKNTGSGEGLYFTVIFLGPGFCVRQLYPRYSGNEYIVHQHEEQKPIVFQTSIPSSLKSELGAEKLTHRDIIRTIVSKRKEVSWKDLEIPDIWDADLVQRPNRKGRVLDVEEEEDIEWWVKDIHIFTLA